MRFSFGGKNYVIEFQRKYREYPVHDYDTGLDSMVQSTYPYTTVTIFESDPAHPFDKKIFRTATTGCFHKDNFSLEKGRVRALRLATITTPKAMKPVMWKAYHDRKSQGRAVAPVGAGDGNPSTQVGSPVEA